MKFFYSSLKFLWLCFISNIPIYLIHAIAQGSCDYTKWNATGTGGYAIISLFTVLIVTVGFIFTSFSKGK